ncbi:MAG: peptide-methionine (R)-S-oxide reductase [Myxococcota bacterium]|jgi:peptide-methionine (R)-S-oxide reductase
MTDKLTRSEQEWKKELSNEEFAVCRQKGTEAAFTGKYTNTKDVGSYLCTCCEEELFRSETKFDSGSGWPSFWKPANDACVEEHEDISHGMRRVEVTCRRCDAHLGHVFSDGPNPSGMRYCINSVSLKMRTDDEA